MLTGWHWPMKHWLSGPHGKPHIPQLFGSRERSTQWFEQSVSGALHIGTHS